jgi:threonine synthase
MYYRNAFPAEYEVTPDSTRANKPELVIESSEKEKMPEADYIAKAAENVVSMLGLEKK